MSDVAKQADSGSPERVALDLADRIAVGEKETKQLTRRFWLQLYAECLAVVKDKV